MKKIVIMLLAAMMLFAFTACDDKPGVPDNSVIIFSDDFNDSEATSENFFETNTGTDSSKTANQKNVNGVAQLYGGGQYMMFTSADETNPVDFSKNDYEISYKLAIPEDFSFSGTTHQLFSMTAQTGKYNNPDEEGDGWLSEKDLGSYLTFKENEAGKISVYGVTAYDVDGAEAKGTIEKGKTYNVTFAMKVVGDKMTMSATIGDVSVESTGSYVTEDAFDFSIWGPQGEGYNAALNNGAYFCALDDFVVKAIPRTTV